jgi:sulfite reductase (NADPH) hemoprotein beta-component
MAKVFAPNLRTPEADHNKTEVAKRESNGMLGNLSEEFRDNDQADVSWETEQLAKSYGIYLEFNRAKTGKEKDWSYMIRVGVPAGGPLTPEQWAVLDDLASRWGVDPEGNSSLRLTTRQAIQFHWVPKEGLIDIVKTCAESGLMSLNGCGDNVRNIMASPFPTAYDLFDGREWAVKSARYFQLPPSPFIQIFAIDPNADLEQEQEKRFKYGKQLLNRKFKMAFGGFHRQPDGTVIADNCTELRTHDLGVSPIYEDGEVKRFQIYVGGGQGEKNGKPSVATLGLPLGIANEEQLLPAMDAVVAVHQEWGDRQNRHWARLKYVIKKQGIEWYREQVEARLGYKLEDPDQDLDIGERNLHHGWLAQSGSDKLAFCAFIENGRLRDNSENGKLKTMVREVAEKFGSTLRITPNQDLVFCDIDPSQKEAFESALQSYGFGTRNGKAYSPLRMLSGSCVGRDTCRLAYTDSEKFEPVLMDELENLGWGEVTTSIGITGCERQCFRPATKAIGLVGSGNNRYHFKLFGTEDGRHQGLPIVKDDRVFLKSVPRDQVPVVIDLLLKHWQSAADEGETFGYFMRRLGADGVLDYLGSQDATAPLLEKSLAHLAV